MVVALLPFPGRTSIPILGPMERMPPGRYSPSTEPRDDSQPSAGETLVLGWIIFLFGTFVIITSVTGLWFLLAPFVLMLFALFGSIVLGLAYSLGWEAKTKDIPPAVRQGHVSTTDPEPQS